MTATAAPAMGDPRAIAIARAFVEARLAARPLAAYPGLIPPSLDAAYAIQDAAIALWPDRVAGWKVGKIPDEVRAVVAADRLKGPVFSRAIWNADPATPTPFPVFVGGFAAVEAEFVYRLGEDAPPGRVDWTPGDAVAIAESLMIGVEAASSPLAAINALGPTVVVSDFGNNAGLILGPEIPGWRGRADADMPCETFIEGVSVGRGSAASLPGGPAASLAFLLGHCAARGRPLKRGDLVTTGAATGIHDIEAGQTARITFGAFGEIACVARPALPTEGLGAETHGDDNPRSG